MERLHLRLKWSALAVALLCALWGVACSPTTRPPAEKAPAAAEAQPQYGGIVRLFGLSSPVHLDMIATGDSSQSRATGGIYERLVEIDYTDPNYSVNRTIAPGLAERWEVASDGKGDTFFLRKGVKWHDGEDLDRKSTRLNSSHSAKSRMPSSA